MAKGQQAKDNVTAKIIATFGSDYVGVFDKKIYLWADDGGERVQVALALTCPKTFMGGDGEVAIEAPEISAPAEITQEEKDNVRILLEKLGL